LILEGRRTKVKKFTTICAVLTMLLVCAGSSSAAPIFFDDFNTEIYAVPGTPSNWTILNGPSGGSVDIIGNGPNGSGWDMIPGNGYYIDLDGSTSMPGLLVTNVPIILPAAGTYVLSYDLAGNQRYLGDLDAVLVDVPGAVGGPWVEVVLGSQPLTSYSHNITVGAPTGVAIWFQDVANTPSDNVGPLLDNVRLDVIPAPGAILLGSIGAGLVGWLRRRRAL
jgi:hypothetical protein